MGAPETAPTRFSIFLFGLLAVQPAFALSTGAIGSSAWGGGGSGSAIARAGGVCSSKGGSSTGSAQALYLLLLHWRLIRLETDCHNGPDQRQIGDHGSDLWPGSWRWNQV